MRNPLGLFLRSTTATSNYPFQVYGDWVLVLSLDKFHVNRCYLPNPGQGDTAQDWDSDAEPSMLLIGENPTEKAVLGDKLKSKLDSLLDTLQTDTHASPFGPTGPSISRSTYLYTTESVAIRNS